MAVFKKNIWFIFYILTLFFLLVFAILSYLSWKTINNEYEIRQENIVRLLSNTTDSLSKAQETILNIIGNHFLEDTDYIDNPNNSTILNKMLKDNPSIDAIAITTPQGKFIFVTGGYDLSKFPNILQKKDTRDSFLETLNSDKMVFGRTYYFTAIKKWITPIRKAIRDKDGKVVMVISAALRTEDSFGKISTLFDKKDKYDLAIIRDVDFYFQYRFNNESNNNLFYLKPISSNAKESIQRAIFDTYHFTMDELRDSEDIASFIQKSSKSTKHLVSLQYNKRYKLWSSVRIPYDLILNDYFKKLSIIFAIFILIETIFFFLFKIIDKAELKRRNDLIFQATHDPLTSLLNRIYLQKNINNWIYEKAPAFSIFYIDMDRFKNINDNYGHEYGDYLLSELAKRLKMIMPKNTVIVRHGGDEFVIFTDITEDAALLDLGNRIIETISKPYKVKNLILSVGASIGISKYPEHGKTLDMLLRASDIAMYESKKIKNCVKLFESSMQESYLKNLLIEQEVKNAINNNELFMVYQPQMDSLGNIHGIEALVRWNNANLGIIPPDQFIPIAENSGQMLRIGHFIIDCTLNEIKEVQKILAMTFQTSINISIRQFMEEGFLEHLLYAIESRDMSNVSITIEITESLLIEDFDYILELLEKIKDFGIQISMDDFGTGYSSLSMLRKLPIDELKIDKSFIDTIVEDITAQKMVQNIIAIGKNLNMYVLAEGVETNEQRALLNKFGCDRYQGYYFAKPLLKDDLVSFFQKN
ncbi:MAG: EAL domain-containing protein [Arcobacter sp.]|uniref:bifunctional diguanylate cyclase/phosphodiesterase n=1 Tax=Arcobacter sp. TaxID=1872629 RepID=UPI003C739C93